MYYFNIFKIKIILKSNRIVVSGSSPFDFEPNLCTHGIISNPVILDKKRNSIVQLLLKKLADGLTGKIIIFGS